MTPSADPKKVAAVAGAAAGAAAGVGAAGLAVLTAQAMRAKREIGPRRTVPPYADGRYGPRQGTSIRIAILGDSAAASLGAERPEQTVGAILAAGVSEVSGRGVVLANMAVVGARSDGLAAQVDRALVIRPHLVVIMIGGNDVTHLRGSRRPASELAAAVSRLRAAGCEAVVGTCPDLGTVRPLSPPLRDVARRLSRTLAAAQTVAVVESGGRSVSLANLLGPEFAARPEALFAADRFHPSAEGYAAVADALLPTALVALGLGPADDVVGEVSVRALPAGIAAARATEVPGTETSPDVPPGDVGAGVRGRLGSVAQLRHRIRRPRPTVHTPDGSDDADEPQPPAAPAALDEPVGARAADAPGGGSSQQPA